MSADENVAAVRRAIDEINAGNLTVIDELFSPEYVFHMPGTPDLDRDGFKQAVATLRAAFPDFRMVLDDIFAAGDKVASRFTHRGTHRGEYAGVPPTGKQITWSGIVISRIEAGKWVEDWEFSDSLGLLQQLGAVTLPKEAEA